VVIRAGAPGAPLRAEPRSQGIRVRAAASTSPSIAPPNGGEDGEPARAGTGPAVISVADTSATMASTALMWTASPWAATAVPGLPPGLPGSTS
jgi:hypothetical protein